MIYFIFTDTIKKAKLSNSCSRRYSWLAVSGCVKFMAPMVWVKYLIWHPLQTFDLLETVSARSL